ncbi:MAG: hypothetical protein PHQ54_03920 [Candidatus Omnitrophica bacterium]|nr:hypothetical protein [Candidatus Omnitrophota bacterium]
MQNNGFIKKLRKLAIEEGASVSGTAYIKDINPEFNLPKDQISGLDYAFSIGVKLSDSILDQITDHPTKLYFHHYRVANMFLDRLSFKISLCIENKGFKALAIPASQIIDWKKQSSYLSHKKIAVLSGLGWIGRNNLLINPEFGARLRLATVLTNLKLPEAKPLDFGCGECFACLSACPVKAIKEESDNFDHMACYNKLDEFRKNDFVGQHICGICVKACKGNPVNQGL